MIRKRWERNNVVVLRSPCDPGKVDFVRLKYFEGEYAKVRRKSGFYTYVAIPRGHCWVEVDNNSPSSQGEDSRTYGPVPMALIEGKVSAVLWPNPRRFVTDPLRDY